MASPDSLIKRAQKLERRESFLALLLPSGRIR
jgi:hypothetical protein